MSDDKEVKPEPESDNATVSLERLLLQRSSAKGQVTRIRNRIFYELSKEKEKNNLFKRGERFEPDPSSNSEG